MAKVGRFLFGVAKLAIWTAGVLLFFRAVAYFVGGDFIEIYVPIAGACTIFFVYFSDIVKRFRLPGDAEGKPSALPVSSDDTIGGNALLTTKDATTMPDKPNVYIDKVLNINHGTINQNTPGGTMNFAPVTYNQNFAAPVAPQDETETANDESAVRGKEQPIPAHIREAKREFKKKWSDLVQIAEILLARPREEIGAKDLWAAIRPGELCDDRARAYVAVCVGSLRDMLGAENNGWRIPKGRYSVEPLEDGSVPESRALADFLSHLRNIDK